MKQSLRDGQHAHGSGQEEAFEHFGLAIAKPRDESTQHQRLQDDRCRLQAREGESGNEIAAMCTRECMEQHRLPIICGRERHFCVPRTLNSRHSARRSVSSRIWWQVIQLQWTTSAKPHDRHDEAVKNASKGSGRIPWRLTTGGVRFDVDSARGNNADRRAVRHVKSPLDGSGSPTTL